MPPTKILFGMRVPYFGAERGASSAEVGAAPTGAAILCIGCAASGG